jgi:hypothetical protein
MHPPGMSNGPGVIFQWHIRDGTAEGLPKPQTARNKRVCAAILARRETCPRLSGIPVHTIDLRW